MALITFSDVPPWERSTIYPGDLFERSAIYRGNGDIEIYYVRAYVCRGFGRWFYCKYCYKHVRPILTREQLEDISEVQICCNRCGAGLTPGFQTIEKLKFWCDMGEWPSAPYGTMLS